MGNLPDYVRHVYKVDKELKTYTVFSIDEVRGSQSMLTDSIRIETFKGKSNTQGANVYLRLRDTSNWANCTLVTGLRPLGSGKYYGDCYKPNVIRNKKKTLLIFTYSTCNKFLFVDVFRDFYPYRPGQLHSIAKSLHN